MKEDGPSGYPPTLKPEEHRSLRGLPADRAGPFGVVHGLGIADGALSFDFGHALYTMSGGIIYGWLRFSTGSLLFPLLAHSFANVAFHLTALVGT